MYKILIGAFVALATAGYLYVSGLPDGKLHVDFLDIGQGDSALIITPHGRTILIDGGAGNAVMGQLGEVLPFFQKHLDYVVATHADKDHIEGLLSVFDRYTVGTFMTSTFNSESGISRRLAEKVRVSGARLVTADENSDFALDGVSWNTLYPFTKFFSAGTDTNRTSIVSRVSYGKTSFLFTGDADEYIEEALIQRGAPVDVDILKVSHHGSKTASSPAFLAKATPALSVISVGLHNTYHHPHPSVLKNLNAARTKIMRTDTMGRVELLCTLNACAESP